MTRMCEACCEVIHHYTLIAERQVSEQQTDHSIPPPCTRDITPLRPTPPDRQVSNPPPHSSQEAVRVAHNTDAPPSKAQA